MKKYYLNIADTFDTRIVYDSEAAQEAAQRNALGVNNLYIDEKDFKFFQVVRKDNMAFVFRRNELLMDNAVCRNQTVDCCSIPCRKISIAGICNWGYYSEDFILKFTDGSESKLYATFADWIFPFDKQAEYESERGREFNLEKHRVLASFNTNGPEVVLSYSTADFGKTRLLDKLMFPDNIFMNVFAVTLEG